MQPAAVPPAAAILRRLPPTPFRTFPLALTVVTVSVVVPVPPAANAYTCRSERRSLPNPASALSVLDEADTVTVPCVPAGGRERDRRGTAVTRRGDEIVMFVAETVMPGLVTVTVVVPEETALDVSPP